MTYQQIYDQIKNAKTPEELTELSEYVAFEHHDLDYYDIFELLSSILYRKDAPPKAIEAIADFGPAGFETMIVGHPNTSTEVLLSIYQNMMSEDPLEETLLEVCRNPKMPNWAKAALRTRYPEVFED
jgi:hypothetical protein